MGPCLAIRGGVCPKMEGVCPGFAQGLPRGLPARRHSFTEGSVAHRPTFCVFGTHGCAWGFVGCMGEHERTSRSWLHPRDWPCCSCWTALLMRQCLVRTVRAGRSVLVSVSTCNVESVFLFQLGSVPAPLRRLTEHAELCATAAQRRRVAPAFRNTSRRLQTFSAAKALKERVRCRLSTERCRQHACLPQAYRVV